MLPHNFIGLICILHLQRIVIIVRLTLIKLYGFRSRVDCSSGGAFGIIVASIAHKTVRRIINFAAARGLSVVRINARARVDLN